MKTEKRYIVQDDRMRHGYKWVVALPGYYRTSDGTMKRDNPKSGPEWGKRDYAMLFKSHRAAARVCNKCSSARIIEASVGIEI